MEEKEDFYGRPLLGGTLPSPLACALEDLISSGKLDVDALPAKRRPVKHKK
ncbi:MAG: hypothetical protein Q8O93_04635 [bacterium]|nr:hypothetical protein [bacterium]